MAAFEELFLLSAAHRDLRALRGMFDAHVFVDEILISRATSGCAQGLVSFFDAVSTNP